MVPGPLCALPSSLSKQPRTVAVNIHVFKSRRARLDFNEVCGTIHVWCLCSWGQQALKGQGVREGWGSASQTACPRLWGAACCGHGGVPDFGAAVCSEKLVATILLPASPHHPPPSPFLESPPCPNLPSPGFIPPGSCSLLLINGWCWVTQLNRSTLP